MFEDDLVEQEKLFYQVASKVAARLKRVESLIPKEAYIRISMVPIWMDYTTVPTEILSGGGACYYTGESWLRRNGGLVEKAHSIEVFNARQYMNWEKERGGFVLLHELTHAYTQVLDSGDHKALMSAYKAAHDSGIYNEVSYRRGSEKIRAYAMTNYFEYFAELTEAYFDTNDFYPNNRMELAGHDPVGYELVEKLWNKFNGMD